MKKQSFSTLIVDKEPEARERVKRLLENSFPSVKVEMAGSVAVAKTAMLHQRPDILFLDVELPDGNGFEILQHLEETTPEVIFVTAHDKYAIRAIKKQANDYILKPVNREEFNDAVGNAVKRLERKRANKEIKEETVKHTTISPDVKKVIIPNLTGYKFVDVQSILRCEADGQYTSIYFTNNEVECVSKNLSYFEQDLIRFGFFRVHHKHLVNLNYVETYSKGKGGGFITMVDNTDIEVSTRKKTELLKCISQGNS